VKAVFTFTEEEIKEMIADKVEYVTEAEAHIDNISDYKFSEDEKTLTVTIDWEG
jgi:hypothetical protein